MLNSNKQIKLGALLSYSAIALNIVAGLIYTPWMIDQIGKSQYGLYTLANSLITLFLVDFGLSSATARYVSKYHAEGAEEKVSNFLGVIYKLYLLIDAVIFVLLIVVFFLLDRIYVNLTPEELAQFKVVYVIAATFSVLNFPFVTLNGILTAYEKFIQLKLADVIYRVLIIGLMVAALLAGFGLYALVTVNAVVGLLIVVYKLIIIRKTTPVKVNFRYSDRALYKDIFGFSIWSTVAALAQRLIFNITPSILGVVSSASAIAVFGIVTTIEGYAYTFTSAINGMFMPRISKIYTEGGSEQKMMSLMMKVGRFQFALNGLIVAGFTVVGKEFISLWMGPDYLDAYYGIVLVIIPGLFFNSLQIGHTAVVVTKHVRAYACVNVLAGVVNVILSLILSSRYGMIGSCASIFVAYMVRAVALNILYHVKLKLNMAYFARHCYLYMSIPVLISVFGGLWITSFIPLEGWLGFAVKGAIVVAVYGALLLMYWLLGRKHGVGR